MSNKSNKWKLSRIYYNKKECELEKFPPKERITITNKLRSINGHPYKQNQEVYSLMELGFEIKPVNNTGEYSKLYKELTDDIKMYEFKMGRSKRVFFFITDNTVNLVAIRYTHY